MLNQRSEHLDFEHFPVHQFVFVGFELLLTYLKQV